MLVEEKLKTIGEQSRQRKIVKELETYYPAWGIRTIIFFRDSIERKMRAVRWKKITGRQ